MPLASAITGIRAERRHQLDCGTKRSAWRWHGIAINVEGADMLHVDGDASSDTITDSTETSEGPTLLIVSKCSLLRSGLAAALTGWPFGTVEAIEGAGATRLGRAQWYIILSDTPSEADADEAFRQAVRFPGVPSVVVTDRFAFDVYAASLRAKASGLPTQDMPLPTLQGTLFLVLKGNTVFPTEPALSRVAARCCRGPSARASMKKTRRSRSIFSRQEIKILDYLVQGDSNKLIARKLGNTEATVKVQMKALLRKLRLQNRTQAAVWAVTNGFGAISPGSGDRPDPP